MDGEARGDLGDKIRTLKRINRGMTVVAAGWWTVVVANDTANEGAPNKRKHGVGTKNGRALQEKGPLNG